MVKQVVVNMALTTEIDIRCYHADGTRRAMPECDSISWEIAERGGMQTGTLQILVPWEQTGWTGTEYIDVRLFGSSQVAYRGWVRQPQQELGNPERSSPTLHGLMEILNGYQVRRDFAYAPAASPAQLFHDLVGLYVTRAGRLPGLQLDTTGVDALGLSLTGLQLTGQSVTQAMDALCDLFPGQLIWGGGVDAQGRNLLYLRPRASTVKYRYLVGRDVTAFVYPRDCTRIVNRIYVTGAKFDGTNGTDGSWANLLTNASFEEGRPNSEADGNLLSNPGFEDSTSSLSPWDTGGATVQAGTGHTGNNSAELNNDTSYLQNGQEYVAQNISIAAVPSGVHASCWWCARAGVVWTPEILLELFNGSTRVAYGQSGFVSQGPDAVGYTFFYFRFDWVPPVGLTADRLRVSYVLNAESATGFAGQTLVDDCAVWLDGPEMAKGWRIGSGVGGGWSGIDWRNRDYVPYDGDVMVRAVASVTGGAGSYAELATSLAERPSAQPLRAYYVQFMIYVLAGSGASLTAAAGVRIYKSGTLKSTQVGTPATLTAGQWNRVGLAFSTGTDCDAIEVFVRAYTSGTYYIDGAGMWANRGSAPPIYMAGDTFQAVRDVTLYSQDSIGVAATQSIATWGERESKVENSNIYDQATLDAYAQSYFRVNAVPQVQGTLRIEGVTSDTILPNLDGQVQIGNLPSAPDALTPARIRYQCGGKIDLNVDLNNERPQLDRLLRLVAAGKA